MLLNWNRQLEGTEAEDQRGQGGQSPGPWAQVLTLSLMGCVSSSHQNSLCHHFLISYVGVATEYATEPSREGIRRLLYEDKTGPAW